MPADLRVDEIWSNPPIRIGKQALHDLLLQWFARLRPDGRAVMVVGKNLGGDSLQAWLTDQGYPTTRLASAKGFRVLESAPGDSNGAIRSSRVLDVAVTTGGRTPASDRQGSDLVTSHARCLPRRGRTA